MRVGDIQYDEIIGIKEYYEERRIEDWFYYYYEERIEFVYVYISKVLCGGEL